MAPNCAVADVTSDAALVVCSSQSIYLTRFGLAPLLGLPLDKIRVQYAAGSNTYGNSCYGEAANAAAILSQEARKPVRLVLSRADELGWDNYGPALLSDLRAGVDAQGKLVALDYQAWMHATAWQETASQLALGTPAPTGGYGVPAVGPGGAGLF
jgi:CO/xanthine dehydrogenase Mo-binding subunit